MSDDDLEKKLLSWLSKQGYPLEMTVASVFARAGFRVIQSEFYSDPLTNKQREIDLYASLQRNVGSTFFRLAVFTECKAGKSKPWIVFVTRGPKLSDAARVVQRSSNSMGLEWLREISRRKDVCELPIFQLPTAPGYGITAAFSDSGVDAPYTAIMGAATAADSEAQAGNKVEEARRFFAVHFPIVVTDAPLFACSLGNDNNPKLERVDKTVLAWRNRVYGPPYCIVHVVAASAMGDFVQQTKADFEYLLSKTESEMTSVLMRTARRW